MALGKNSKGDFRSGNPVNWLPTPAHFGTIVNLSATPEQDFGNPIPSNGNNENAVTWSPSPAHFGNSVGGTATTPTFAPPAGTYPESQVVQINAVADAIYFTTDGTAPSAATSRLYKGSIRVNVSQTIKAIAIVNGVASSVGTAAYVIS